MTYPSVVDFEHGFDSVTTSHVITIPTGSVGDLLIASVSIGDNIIAMTWPAGWTAPPSGDLTYGSNDGRMETRYRVADGTEGASITVTTGTICTSAWHVYRLTDYQGAPVMASHVGALSPVCDPPNLISGFGTEDTLWIALGGWANGQRGITGYPSGYSSGTYDTLGSTVSSAAIATARKTTTASSENPGAFTIASSGAWNVAFTIAIRGADALTADFDANPSVGSTPLTVDFTDQSSGGTGTIDTWAWDFGDGSTSTSQNPTHIYTVSGQYTVTLDIENSTGQTASVTKTALITAGTDYVPPEAGNAVIEIYVAVAGSARWGVAHWGEDVWSAAQWVDVTPQSVDAVVRWGSHQPEAGILAETEAASWIVDTYDPDRLLDPGNTDSPYHTDLRAGLPIRVRHRGTIVRQGVCETIAYYHAGKRGGIRVTDNLSLLARTPVPDDTVLSDTLRARARDVIAAAGLAVTVEPDPPSGDPALAPRLDGDRSAWRHIADAAEQVLHIAYIDRIGTLKFRAWASPYDRNRGVDGTNLVDLGVIVQTRGLYSVVQAQQTVGDGGLLIERRLTPPPRYGAVTYSRTDPTPDAGAWADAVLADRSLQTVQWILGEIYPITADDVEYFATLEAMERFGVDHADAEPPVDITGIIVGGEFRVTGKKDSAAVWGFQLELAQTAQSPLYTDTDPAEFLLNDFGDGYLYAD